MERYSLKDFVLSKNNRCLIATPVSHLPLVKEYIVKYSNFFQLKERANKDELVNVIDIITKQLEHIMVKYMAQQKVLLILV